MFLFHVLPKISVRLADVGAEIASEEEAVVHGALVDLEVVLLSRREVAHVAVVADPEVLRLPVLLQIVGAGGDVITLITRISNTFVFGLLVNLEMRGTARHVVADVAREPLPEMLGVLVPPESSTT